MSTSQNFKVGFIGAGNVAKIHVFAQNALQYYYKSVPDIELVVVASNSLGKTLEFSKEFRFKTSTDTSSIWKRNDINTLFICSPNEFHFPQLLKSLQMPEVKHIYVEKPICTNKEETGILTKISQAMPLEKNIQIGFQFLQMPAVIKALELWKKGTFGQPIHFNARYLHSGYLKPEYRIKRRSRLQAMPVGGALGDLGSHTLSLLVAFLGESLKVTHAKKSGSFQDVPNDSDLCTILFLQDLNSKAIGTMTASRISAGAGEVLELEIRASNGALRFSTKYPDILEIWNADDKEAKWARYNCGSRFISSKFPGSHNASGWLRSFIHAHYLFFGGKDENCIVPNLQHAIKVQRLINEAVDQIKNI